MRRPPPPISGRRAVNSTSVRVKLMNASSASPGSRSPASWPARGADVLVVDRYEIGERQTSACGIPTEWLRAAGPDGRRAPALRHAGHAHPPRRPPATGCPGPSRPSTTASSASCSGATATRRFETAKVERARARRPTATARSRSRPTAASISAPLVVDALGWRRMLAAGDGYQPPDAPLSRGLEVHPGGSGEDLEIWIDRRYVPAGYGWSFPARDELRIGVGSFDPRFHVRDTTELLAEDLGKRAESATRATGSRTSCAARPRAASSSPATRPATACRSPPRGSGPRSTSGSRSAASCARVVEGRQSREQAAAPLRRVQRLPRVEVPLDAARAEAGAADPAAPARRR